MTSPIRERYHLTFPASKVQRSSRRGRKVSIDIGDVVVGRRTVLIALDETGDEEFSKREVFGFGGVIGFGGAIRHAEKIWRGMKARDFGGEDQPVHATTRWSQQQLDAISTFFRRSRLGRFAFVLRRPPLTMGSINALDVLKPVMLRQLMQALADTPILPDRIVVMFEKSDRLLPKVMEELRGIGIKGGGKQIPLTWLFSHKLPPKPWLTMSPIARSGTSWISAKVSPSTRSSMPSSQRGVSRMPTIENWALSRLASGKTPRPRSAFATTTPSASNGKVQDWYPV